MAGTCTGPGPCDTSSFGAGKNWVNKVGGLPDYIRAVAHAFRRKGLSESEAIQRAVGVVKNWAEGKGGVTAETRARAAKAVAEWEAKKAASHSLTASPSKHMLDLGGHVAATVDLAWNEALHPRKGGKFAPKGSATTSGSSSTLPPNMAANVRDFQKRTGLPVTGVIDAATAAKIRAETTAKGSTGGKGRHKGRKPKTVTAKKTRSGQRRALGQHVATVNSLPTAQRAIVRQRMPVPPTGYVWTASNNLRAVPLTAAQQAAPLIGLP